jgi:hypothetical protein
MSRGFPKGVSEVLERAERNGASARLQCVAPDDEYSVDGHTRVMLYSRPNGPFARFDKDDFVVPKNQVVPLARALLEAPEDLRRFERYRQDTSHTRDIFVCAHGSRDVCCGSVGYPIYQVLRHRYALELGDKLRVFRVSHLGGHRLAPNLVDLPEGRNWVRLGENELDALVFRDRPVSELKPHYRAWLGLDSPFEQVAEGEAFMREGWDWTRRQISGRTLLTGDDGKSAEVRIGFSDPQGTTAGAYEVSVDESHTVPFVGCLGPAKPGVAPQYTVRRLTKVD